MPFVDHGTLALLIPLAGIGTGALAVYLSHVRKIEELRARNNYSVETSVGNNRAASTEVRAELDALRREVEILRDNSTRFDLSFDAGLTRLEERLSHVEENQNARGASTIYTNREEPAVLMVRNR